MIRDLGTMVIASSDREDPVIGRKPAAVLALLAMNAGRRVSVDALVDALWGDQATQGAMSTLQSHVWRLRGQLESQHGSPVSVVSDSGGYRLLATPDQVDSSQLERLVADARASLTAGDATSALRLADVGLGLWRGRPYEPFSDEEWADAAVARLEESYLQGQELRIDALLDLGRTDEALVATEASIRQSGYRERPYMQRLIALHQAGRSEEALQTFQDFRRGLVTELGLEPGAELVDLQRRILDQDATLATPRRPSAAVSGVGSDVVHLPGKRSPLIGREADVLAVQSLVTPGAAVTITGPAGCGKTRLAIDVARGLAADFPQDVRFVDITAVQSADLVPEAIIGLLGIRAAGAGSPLGVLASYLRHRRILLVLDNCEHLLPELTLVVETLLGDAGSSSAVLATSREPLNVDGESIWPLQPLALPGHDASTEDGAPSPAVELFLLRAAAAVPTTTLEGDDLRTVESICVGLDGLPLAIELAAARLRAYSIDEIAEQVGRDPLTLARLHRSGNEDHHRSLSEAIQWSVALLSPEERRMHQELSVLTGPFTARAVHGVSDAVDGATRRVDVDTLLPMLVNRSLLTRERADHSSGQSTFSQLSTVRTHATHLLAGAGGTERMLERRDAWVLDRIRLLPRIGHPDSARRYRRFHDDYSTVRSTLQRRLSDHPDPRFISGTVGLTFYWYWREQLLEGWRWLDLAAEVAENEETSDHLRVLSHLACAASLLLQVRLDLASPHLDRALPLISSLDEPDLIAVGDLLSCLVVAAAVTGETQTAMIALEHLDAVAHRTGDANHRVLADAARCLVTATSATGPLDLTVIPRVHDVYAEALELQQLFACWMCSTALAHSALRTARPDDGLAWAKRAIALSVEFGASRGGTWVEVLADLTAMSGQDIRAVQLFSAAHAASSRTGARSPNLPISRELHAASQRRLDRATYDEAWRVGQLLTLSQITGATTA